MFIIVKKVHRTRLLAGCALFALTLCLIATGAVLAKSAEQAQVLAHITLKLKSNEDRIAYLESRGWIIETEPAAVEDVLIPETFDASYDEYLSLQRAQGFSLEELAGKTVQRYTYQVLNYPGVQENVWASLLIYKKNAVGGEVFCSAGDGFTQGLDYPAGQKATLQVIV